MGGCFSRIRIPASTRARVEHTWLGPSDDDRESGESLPCPVAPIAGQVVDNARSLVAAFNWIHRLSTNPSSTVPDSGDPRCTFNGLDRVTFEQVHRPAFVERCGPGR